MLFVNHQLETYKILATDISIANGITDLVVVNTVAGDSSCSYTD